VNLIAVIMLNITGLLAVAPVTTAKAAPVAAKSPPPMSKYQRAMQERFHNSAPADEYFGKMKMSYLGINNTFHDASISAGQHTTEHWIINKVDLADDALQDWSKHYPHDPQLARTYFLAIEIQKKIWLQPNQERAWIYMNRMVTLFPDTYFGKLVKKDMAIGFTEHYYGEPVPCATPQPPAPTPEAVATEAPRRGRGKAAPTPEPTVAPTPPPTMTPQPQPTPRVIKDHLKVQVEIPPCVAPPTPNPAAMPASSSGPAMTQPLPSGSPAPHGMHR
jgi:hypothetical protein